jgi:hypothetical protein
MHKKKAVTVASCSLAACALSMSIAIAAAGDGPQTQSKAAVFCEEAMVSPVSGHAECVRPFGAPVDAPPPRPSLVNLAVFDFELEDATPAATLVGQSTNTETVLEQVSSEARRMLMESGRYRLVDVSKTNAEPVRPKGLRNCEGCEAGIAMRAGADQALLGVVKRITQTDYYVVIQITDARTGKVLDQQAANFAGGPDGWASGVRMLLKHQVLATSDGS